jgi:hypothetical protein
MKIYISSIKPMVTYAPETWTLTERNMNYLMIFERRILRKIFGPVQEGDGWRIRNNHELSKLIGGANILMFIKAQRLKWWGHMHRMEEYIMFGEMLKSNGK